MSSIQGLRPMKVRVIITKFVEADAGQFKSVVQCLTGKDSVVAEASESSNHRSAKVRAADRSCGVGGRKPVMSGVEGQRVKEEEGGVKLLSELDELFEWLRD